MTCFDLETKVSWSWSRVGLYFSNILITKTGNNHVYRAAVSVVAVVQVQRVVADSGRRPFLHVEHDSSDDEPLIWSVGVQRQSTVDVLSITGLTGLRVREYFGTAQRLDHLTAIRPVCHVCVSPTTEAYTQISEFHITISKKYKTVRSRTSKPSRYVISHPGQLSLAIPPWVGV